MQIIAAMKTATANDTIAIRSTSTRASIMVWEIRAKDCTRGGMRYVGDVLTGHHAEIVPGARIRLFGLIKAGERYVMGANGRRVPCEAYVYRRDFAIGDCAEYGSYNMSYTGTITAITEKTVTITEDCGGGRTRPHRLDLYSFSRRNWNFSVEESARRNAEWYD